MGQHGVNAVLNASGLTRFVSNYPPSNLEACVPFEEYATVVKAVEAFTARAREGAAHPSGPDDVPIRAQGTSCHAGVAGLALR